MYLPVHRRFSCLVWASMLPVVASTLILGIVKRAILEPVHSQILIISGACRDIAQTLATVVKNAMCVNVHGYSTEATRCEDNLYDSYLGQSPLG